MTDVAQSMTLAAALVGMATGIGGLVLGIANHRHQIRASAARLRVIPGLAFAGPADELVRVTYLTPDVEEAMGNLKTYASIEVKNLGEKPVCILEMGFVDRAGQRLPWRDPYWLEPRRPFPLVLEPGETGAAYLRVDPAIRDSIHPVAYALTDCGERFEGSSPVMDDLALRRIKEENADG